MPPDGQNKTKNVIIEGKRTNFKVRQTYHWSLSVKNEQKPGEVIEGNRKDLRHKINNSYISPYHITKTLFTLE